MSPEVKFGIALFASTVIMFMAAGLVQELLNWLDKRK
jgi:prepilin signal peptidase PulO-like enzyme (type II secretory pathway)